MGTVACTSCGTESPAGARFCMECGTAFARSCPSCGSDAPPEARFCMECGTSLAAATAASVATAPAATPPEERRQVTILFADLSGYTAVSENMDPEAVKGLVERALHRLGEEVTRFGGTVDKYIGDNVMALFGAPVAHEDDAERAIRAGLGMQAAMAKINEDLGASYGASFALRVGINTGEVMAGAMGSDYTVIGDAVNVAARLQAAGRPGTVTVGERTRRATARSVDFAELEPLTLKGKADPVPAYEAVGLLAAHAQGRPTPSEAPLVGRADELELLGSLFDRTVADGRPHLVTMIGQAGVGKSRLLREFENALADRDTAPVVLQGRCLPYGASIVYWALNEVLRAECGIVDGDPAELAWEKLSSHLGALLEDPTAEGEPAPERRAALIGRLLGIEAPGMADLVEAQDPQRMRESFFSAVRSAIEAMARRRPLVLAFEDIHWADGGMLDLVEYLGRFVRGPLLVLCLARDELLERREHWGAGRRGETVRFLDPLSETETAELVRALLPEGPDRELVEAVIDRAGGNPFFAEEMVRRVTEEDAVAAAELPDTVQAVLAARLDSLEPAERRLVQQASVIGRTFWEDALAPVAAQEGADLRAVLASLQEKDIVVPGEGSRLAGEPELAFKHVLIRDVAYGMLPKAVRARKHVEVGAFIEDRSGDRADEVVALLAEHYGRAATLGEEARLERAELEPIQVRALHFLEAAGDAAASFYSNPEAFSHYAAARELGSPPNADPGTRARVGEKQGDVALRLGRVDAALEVWEECLEFHRVQEDLERVAGLHRKIGAGLAHKGERKQAIEHYQQGINLLKDGPPNLELVRLYEEAAWLYMQTGDNMLAIYASEKALRLAERLGEAGAASRAHGIFGRVFGRIGDTVKARDNLEKSVELARGSDQGETILALLALGHHLETAEADYATAEQAYADGLALAEQVGDIPAQVELYAALAQLAVHRADWEAVRRFGDSSKELSEREGLVGKLCLPYALEALLRWRDGDWEGAEGLYVRAHSLAVQVGWSEVAYAALFGLATARQDHGDHPGALTALSQALDICERAGLIGQSIEAIAARAIVLASSGRDVAARDAAEEAVTLAERLHYPVGQAAARQADGATAPGPEGVDRLRDARALWQSLGRPLSAARCDLLTAAALRRHHPAEAPAAFAAAQAAFDELGVHHLAEQAEALA